MASLDSLPADQRAVLQLVLSRGRSYDQIADMLSIDRAGVRQRALEAFDAIGPQTRVPAERRALITDYLLGQLPPRVAEDTRARLAESPVERAWARVVASELAPLASGPLPEIPVESGRREAPAAEPVVPEPSAPARPAAEPLPAELERPQPERTRAAAATKRSSRRGGAIVLGVIAAAIVAVVVVLIANSGSSSNNKSASSSTATAAASTSAAATTTGTAGTTTSSTTPQIISQVNLTSPSAGAGSKTAGIAAVFKRGGTTGILITAQNVPPNTKHDAYAVWLYNSPSDSKILGFVNPGVGSNGRLSTAGALPTNAGRFKQLLVTLETQRTPTQPGKIILQGTLTGLS